MAKYDLLSVVMIRNDNMTADSSILRIFERARKSGVCYITRPGNSVRDNQVITTCEKYGMVMVLTGIRLFHH